MGGHFTGIFKKTELDEYERKEELRKNRRRPVQETIEQLGEGRGEASSPLIAQLVANDDAGIYGPGYRERRADRLKERYGLDVPRT